MKKSRAFTLFELIMTVLLLAIIGASTVAFFIPLANLLFYSPTQLMVDNTAQDMLSIIIEGDSRAKGLRFSKSIGSADEDQITFTDCDNNTVTYRWDNATRRIYGEINSQGENPIPYSYYHNVTVRGKTQDSEIFQYYNSSGTKLSTPISSLTSVESIKMEIIVETGAGGVEANHGRIDIETGVDIKQFI